MRELRWSEENPRVMFTTSTTGKLAGGNPGGDGTRVDIMLCKVVAL